jgi:hypothetical protein
MELTLPHLTYMGDGSVERAKQKLVEMASGGGDDRCCHPQEVPVFPSPGEWAASIAANGGKIPKPKLGTTIEQWGQALAESHGNVPLYSERSVYQSLRSGMESDDGF